MSNELLSEKFLDIVKRIGMDELKLPIFYNAPVGIRFEIGNPEKEHLIYNPVTDEYDVVPEYINDAYARVKKIYQSIPNTPDILRIDLCIDYEDNYHENVLLELNLMGLPKPDEIKKAYHCDDDEIYEVLECYWDLTKNASYVNDLLYCIIMSENGGTPYLAMSTYFANSTDATLFWPYDDRGADLVASNKEILLPIYLEFNNWILDYDRERIDKTFAK